MGPVGLILAGGRARRMGGGDKPLRLLGGRPLLAHVAERLGPQCATLLLSANGEAARFSPWRGPVVPDHAADVGCGPLAGLLAGLDTVARDHAEATRVLTVPGDTPFLPPDLASRLTEACPPAVGIAVARSAGREHPLVALWPLAIRHDLRRLLRIEGTRRVRDLLARRRVVAVDWPAAPVDPFFNVNTLEDLAAAEAFARPP